MAINGIWLPNTILIDANLTQTEKIILSEIMQLVSLEHGCIASNNHFSTLIGITKPNVSRALKSLSEKGYISIEIESGSRNHSRVIKLINPIIKTATPPLSKQQETIVENNNASNETLKAFENLWRDYTLTFLKRQNRKGGAKEKAKAKYLKLAEKYSYDDIYSFVEDHSSQSIGHKDLERLLTPDNIKQYFEDLL